MIQMLLHERIKSLTELGKSWENLHSPEIDSVIQKAKSQNPWFTEANILNALSAIRDEYLNANALQKVINKYHIDDNVAMKTIGLILAGNIPLVGFHDVLCCYICGHKALIKYSDKDRVLMNWVVDEIIKLNPEAREYFHEIEKLENFNAVIATGSNNSAMHFEYYFRDVPHIIRRNRNSISVLTGDETSSDLQNLGTDIFSYFGLGCRNVSFVYVPKGYDIRKLFDEFDTFKEIIYHHKYKNNFDYNFALLLLNKEDFLQSDFLIIKESNLISSRIATLHFKYYEDIETLKTELESSKAEIQCIVSGLSFDGLDNVGFGKTQSPSIDTYADGIDTMQFLLSI